MKCIVCPVGIIIAHVLYYNMMILLLTIENNF